MLRGRARRSCCAIGTGALLAAAAVTDCTGGSNAVGVVPDGAPDAPADVTSCTAGTIRFRFTRTSSSRYCLGAPNTCTVEWLSLRRYDGGEELPLERGCLGDCTSCEPVGCPALCAIPQPFDAAVEWTWDGTYFPRRGCDGAAMVCADTACATRGRYIARMCAHRDLAADAGPLCVSSPTASCVEVELDWPPETGAAEVAGVLRD